MSTKTTYKQTELGLIPEDWEVKKLGDLGEFFKGKGVPKSNIVEEGKYKCLTYGDLYTKYDYVIQNVKSFLNEENILESQEIKYGDICIAGSGETLEDIGKCAVFIDDEIGYAGGDIIVFRSNENSLTLSYILNSDISKKQKYRLGQGHSVVHIYSSQLQNLKIPLPPLLEQKKIADCLSTWDSAIEKQSALINALTDRKKALMQQLLTGIKRLPGFEGKWKEVKLGEIGEIQTGNTPSKLESENWNGEYYWCTAEDMKSKYVNNTAQKLTKKGWSLARTVKANSILVTCIASIGINAITNVECSFNQQINSITPNENFSTEFIYYLMNNSKENLLKYAGAGALPMLNKNTFSSIKFKFPTLSEQTAIAEILATADRELQLQKEKLAQLQIQKKGLMQVLLTGKKRLIN